MSDLICIVCPNGCRLRATYEGGELKVEGNKCPKGTEFARKELTAPTRSVTGTVATVFAGYPVLTVKTKGEIPKEKVKELAALLKRTKVKRVMRVGESVIENALGTGVDVVATTDMSKLISDGKG
ncbi:MAG TPA: DUF1667 domain-containing protein [Candidatus Stercoripulliclostridium merdipullorum]|uniref:DUF1667 domain-containing protein n=1 Tax=Candidatus Stercoripulliclostridium merdipullorum TaxID=2840952 RepID=A0A9D1NCN3_9FIRM|nr:DUF1667 domain-containing protein [Candidatus Stercoripulliclostridium merdipullorum]